MDHQQQVQADRGRRVKGGMHPIDHVARLALWKDTDSINERGEFRQHLHIFGMLVDKGSSFSSLSLHRAFPWLRVMDKPDFAELDAIYSMTRFHNWPAMWAEMFMPQVTTIELEIKRNPLIMHGPYWMLLGTHAESHVAQMLVGMKRRITNEMFANGAPFSGELLEIRVRLAMRDYRIFKTSQEIPR